MACSSIPALTAAPALVFIPCNKSYCTHSSETAETAWQHFRLHAATVTRHPCPYCLHGENKAADLRYHIKTQHDCAELWDYLIENLTHDFYMPLLKEHGVVTDAIESFDDATATAAAIDTADVADSAE